MKRTPPPKDGKAVVVTEEGEDLKDDTWDNGIVEEVGLLVVLVGEDTGVDVDEEGEVEREVEGVREREGEEVVRDELEVVRVGSSVEEGSVVSHVSDETEEIEEIESSEEVEVERFGMLVGEDKSDNKVEVVEGSIEREEPKGDTLLELDSGGRVTDEETSVEVSVDGSGSVDVGVGVLNVPVLDGNSSVAVGSPV